MSSKYNGANWIDWSFTGETISPEALNNLFDKYKITKVIPTKDGVKPQTKLNLYDEHSVCISHKHNCSLFYMVRKEKTQITLGSGRKIDSYTFRPYIYRVSANNCNETSDHTNPGVIFNEFTTMFRNHYGKTFSSVYEKMPKECGFKGCIPSPLNYGLRDIYPYHHVYKADISSAYGYELSKDVPTAKDCLEFEEYREPNSEFKFAFYPNDHALAVYGEDIAPPSSFNKNSCKKTYLMKASECPIKPIIEMIYQQKEAAETKADRQKYKDLLNIPVGYFQRNENPAYAYITAVVIARCNKRVSDWRDKIEEAGNQVILINTDAIAWDGEPMPELYTNEKALGNFVLEHEDAKAYVRGAKCYQILDNGELTTIYAGMPERFQKELKFGDIVDKKYDLEGYVWDNEQLRYRVVYLNEFYMERGKRCQKM